MDRSINNTPTHLLKQFRGITIFKPHTHTLISKTKHTIFISKMQPTGSSQNTAPTGPSQNMAHRPISKHGPPAHLKTQPSKFCKIFYYSLSQYKIISNQFTQCANESPTSRPGVMTVPLPRSHAHI
jgi:hypothetical protein